MRKHNLHQIYLLISIHIPWAGERHCWPLSQPNYLGALQKPFSVLILKPWPRIQVFLKPNYIYCGALCPVIYDFWDLLLMFVTNTLLYNTTNIWRIRGSCAPAVSSKLQFTMKHCLSVWCCIWYNSEKCGCIDWQLEIETVPWFQLWSTYTYILFVNKLSMVLLESSTVFLTGLCCVHCTLFGILLCCTSSIWHSWRK